MQIINIVIFLDFTILFGDCFVVYYYFMKNLTALVSDIAALSPDERSRDVLKQIKRSYAKINGLARIPTNIQILREYHHLVMSGEVDKDI